MSRRLAIAAAAALAVLTLAGCGYETAEEANARWEATQPPVVDVGHRAESWCDQHGNRLYTWSSQYSRALAVVGQDPSCSSARTSAVAR